MHTADICEFLCLHVLTRNILDCDQSNILLVRIIFSCILLAAFCSLLFTPQIAVPTASLRRQHQLSEINVITRRKENYSTLCVT